MHIFIDESGPFAFPPPGKPGLSCVGALVIPEATHSLTMNQFNHHSHRWGGLGREVKGSALNERQVATVIDVLLRYRAVFFVSGTIMSGLSPAIVADGKKVQGERLTASLTENHQPTLVQQLIELRSRVETMSAPEFVQFILLQKLVENVLRVIPNYFGFKGPRELGRFLWKADAKNNGRSSYEICWGKLGAGLLQSAFLARPPETDPRGDYRDFYGAYLFKTQEWPDHLPRPVRGGSGRIMDLGAVLRESFSFVNSRDSAGIQLADVVTNAFRRAVMGNLGRSGWDRLGELILRFDGRAIDLIHLPLPAGQSIPDLPVNCRRRLDEIDARAVAVGP